MSRNLKVLGLALVAALALTAVAASAASAASFTTTSGATVSADQKTEHKFTVTGQTVTCKNADFDGTAPSGNFAEIAVAATYSECKSEPLGASATVSGFGAVNGTNSCWYVIKANGGAELKCNGTGEVTVTALTCQVHVPAQAFASGVSFTNGTSGGKSDITAAFEVKGIEGNHTDGFLCPFGSSGVNKEGILEGESTVTAKVGSEVVNGSHDA